MAIAIEVVGLVHLRRAQTVEQVCDIIKADAFLDIVFPVVTVIILLAGLLMVFTSWGWGNACVDVLLGLLILLSIQRPVVNARYMRQILSKAQAHAHAPIPSELSAKIAHPSALDFGLKHGGASSGIVYMMTLKPDLIGSLLSSAHSFPLGRLLSGLLFSR